MRKYLSSVEFAGLFVLIVLPLIALGILSFTDTSFFSMFEVSAYQLQTIPLALSIGILLALFMLWVGEFRFFDQVLVEYSRALSTMKITRWRAVFLSICPAIGEEILYRGTLQPLLGLWLTAFIFVISHTYLYSEKLTKENAFPFFIILIFFFLIAAFFGWVAKEYSLWHVMALHFTYNLVQFMYLRKTGN